MLTVQPLASPRLVGCEDSVELLTEKPVGVVQVPDGVVHTSADNDWRTVDEGTVKLKVYVVVAFDAAALDELIVSLRELICAADAKDGTNISKYIIRITAVAKIAVTRFREKVCISFISRRLQYRCSS